MKIFTIQGALGLCLSFLALLPLAAEAQFYSCINKRRVDFFYTADPLAPNQRKMVKLKVDYIDQIASDSIMYLGPEFNGGTRMNNQNPLCPKTQSRTWAGDAISRRFRDNVFINQNGWSFNLKWNVSLGRSFQFNTWNTDSIRMQLTLSAVELSNYFGRPDSVRIFTINRIDAQGNIVPYLFNGKTMIVSKNYGLVKGYQMNLFPYDTNVVWRASAATPQLPYATLRSREIYGLATGDEYHIVTYCPACAGPGGPIKFTKRKVTAVDNSVPTQVTFTFADSVKIGNSNTAFSTKTQRIVYADVAYLDSSTFAQITRGAARPYSRVILFQRIDALGNRLKVQDTAAWVEDATGGLGCFRSPQNVGLGNYRYFEKAGGPWSENSGETDVLVYISNSTGIKGTPIYLGGTVVGLSTASRLQTLSILPNPATESAQLVLPTDAQIVNIRAYDPNGKTNELGTSPTLDLSSMAKGIYHLMVETNKGHHSSRLVVQ